MKEPDYIRYHKERLDLTYCKDFSQLDRSNGLEFRKRAERSPNRNAKFAKEFDNTLVSAPASPKNQDIVNVISGGDKKVPQKYRTAAVPQS
jgi:hypothetical protein